MESVWVVETGEYSDYRVLGIFSTEENAQKIADLVDGDVSEWPIDPWLEQLSQGRRSFRVEMMMDGTGIRVSEMPWGNHHKDEFSLVRNRNSADLLIGNVFARGDQHAIKIVTEVRAQYIASGALPE
jgi:hypothetical protein